jgi:predicted SAM-dependent methyltransferase
MLALGKKFIKGSLLSIWPIDLVTQVLFETKASAKHFKAWLFERSRFRGQKNLRLNIGCGTNVSLGWTNVDLDGPPEVFHWDCRRGMPFDDESVDAIFAEHVFEHFDPVTGAKFLSECYRCLRTGGGLVRIVVPDAGKYLQLYLGDWSGLAAARPLIEEDGKYHDFWLQRVYRTKMELINEVFRQGTEHKYVYDADTLMMKLRDAGFLRVIHQSYGVTAGGETPLDTQARSGESLYVEAIK